MMPIDVQQSAKLGEDVAGDEDRLSHPPQFLQEGLHFDPRPRIQSAGRLVENQHRRIVDERLGQAEPLLHAARQAVDERLALAGQVEQIEHVADDLPPAVARNLVGHGEEVQELPDFHAVVDAEVVGHVADAAAHAQRILADAMPVDDPVAAGGLQQRGQKADRGALARPVGSDEAEHLARLDLQGQAIDRQQIAVSLCEVDAVRSCEMISGQG